MDSERKNVVQPTAWWVAVEAQMKRDGETNRSRWIGECIVANLDADLRMALSDRPAAHRPTKPSGNET